MHVPEDIAEYYLTTADVAAILGLKKNTIHQMVQDGRLACRKLGFSKQAHLRFAFKDLRAFMRPSVGAVIVNTPPGELKRMREIIRKYPEDPTTETK